MANVSYGGLAAGWARGGAPRARLAVYKALWGVRGRGGLASVLAAIDDAVYDGVDVLNLSIAGSEDAWLPTSLHAIKRGITMVYAAGNDGPYSQTVANTPPWVITVAASSLDRSFPTTITLGDNRTLVVSVSVLSPFLLIWEIFSSAGLLQGFTGSSYVLGGRKYESFV